LTSYIRVATERNTKLAQRIRKAVPLQAWTGPGGFRHVKTPRFQDNRHMKALRLSALSTGHLYPTGNIPGTHFWLEGESTQGPECGRKGVSMKNFN
jgi:hypothetical protein